MSIIPEELLYQEAINKEALFCFYTNIYIDKTVKEGAAACYGSLNNIKNLINKKEIKHNVINIYLHMVTELLLGATNTTTAATQNGLDIGDYTGIVALAATSITFFLTYHHGSQSEQTRI